TNRTPVFVWKAAARTLGSAPIRSSVHQQCGSSDSPTWYRGNLDFSSTTTRRPARASAAPAAAPAGPPPTTIASTSLVVTPPPVHRVRAGRTPAAAGRPASVPPTTA